MAHFGGRFAFESRSVRTVSRNLRDFSIILCPVVHEDPALNSRHTPAQRKDHDGLPGRRIEKSYEIGLTRNIIPVTTPPRLLTVLGRANICDINPDYAFPEQRVKQSPPT